MYYMYNGHGDVAALLGEGGTVKGTYYYDAFVSVIEQTGKQIRKIYPGGKKTIEGKTVYDPAKTETYTYNADGTPATKKDRNGQTTSYKNDIHGRVITKTIDKKEIAYTYDANGNQLTITDETGKTARIYDGLNRVITKSVPHLGASTYEYDIPVNSQTVPEMTASYTLPEGSTAEKTTDAKGNETTKIYDGAGRLAYVIAEGQVTGYTYDANGSRQSVKYPDGATEEKYEYDKNNRLKKLTNLKKDGTILEEYKYTYDGAGNQTTKTETIQGKEKGTTAYRYDSLNRLLEITEPQQETGSRKTTGYTYDASGNRETEQVQAKTATGTAITLTTYKNDEQNRLVAATEEKGDGTKKTTTYVYDNNGNLTRKSMEQTREIDPSNPPKAKFGMYIEGQQDGATKNAKPIVAGTASYEYDVWNQLVKATTGEGTSTYKYNGEGYRTEKTENGKTTRSLYEGDKVILETDENGKETARNIYGTNLIARTVTTRESGTTKEETYSYMYNGHGDVTALLGADGTVAASYYYDAFGNITEQTGSVNNNITYAGYQYDNETDLYYLNARYYDSKIARFISEDTYTGDQNDPLSLNLYTYCHNEPVMYDDPTGHFDTTKRYDRGDGTNAVNTAASKDVKELQKALEKLGYLDTNGAYGYFGSKTEDAVNAFKDKYKLGNTGANEGVVGGTTWAKIQEELTKQNKSSGGDSNSTKTSSGGTSSSSNEHKNTQNVTPKNVDTSDVKITYYSSANTSVLSNYTLNLTKTLAAESGNDTIVITRTIATPESQARAMYNNLERTGPEVQRDIYGSSKGSVVIDTYEASKAKGKTAKEIQADMVKTIIDVGPSNVSKHCYTVEQYKELNTFDVSYSKLDDPKAFRSKLNEAQKNGLLKYIVENGCFHIQVYQKKR